MLGTLLKLLDGCFLTIGARQSYRFLKSFEYLLIGASEIENIHLQLFLRRRFLKIIGKLCRETF